MGVVSRYESPSSMNKSDQRHDSGPLRNSPSIRGLMSPCSTSQRPTSAVFWQCPSWHGFSLHEAVSALELARERHRIFPPLPQDFSSFNTILNIRPIPLCALFACLPQKQAIVPKRAKALSGQEIIHAFKSADTAISWSFLLFTKPLSFHNRLHQKWSWTSSMRVVIFQSTRRPTIRVRFDISTNFRNP